MSADLRHATTAQKIRGGFTLDTRDGIRKGGDNGPAIVLGDPKPSLLVKAIRHQDETLKMPPKKKRPDEVVADIEKWIAMAAPDPRDAPVKVAKAEIDIEKGRKGVSPERAVRWARMLGLSDVQWLRLALQAELDAAGTKVSR